MRNSEKTPCSVSVFPVNAKRITYLENFGEKRKTKNKLHPGDWGHQRWAMGPWCQACYLPCNLTGMVRNGVLFRLPDHRQALLSPRDRTDGEIANAPGEPRELYKQRSKPLVRQDAITSTIASRVIAGNGRERLIRFPGQDETRATETEHPRGTAREKMNVHLRCNYHRAAHARRSRHCVLFPKLIHPTAPLGNYRASNPVPIPIRFRRCRKAQRDLV